MHKSYLIYGNIIQEAFTMAKFNIVKLAKIFNGFSIQSRPPIPTLKKMNFWRKTETRENNTYI